MAQADSLTLACGFLCSWWCAGRGRALFPVLLCGSGPSRAPADAAGLSSGKWLAPWQILFPGRASTPSPPGCSAAPPVADIQAQPQLPCLLSLWMRPPAGLGGAGWNRYPEFRGHRGVVPLGAREELPAPGLTLPDSIFVPQSSYSALAALGHPLTVPLSPGPCLLGVLGVL